MASECCISPEDCSLMENLYRCIHPEEKDVATKVRELSVTVKEYYSGRSNDPTLEEEIRRKGFSDWIDRETHYALKKADYNWIDKVINPNGGYFIGENIESVYHDMRERILRAAILRIESPMALKIGLEVCLRD